MRPSRSLRLTGALALAVCLGLSACGGDDAAPNDAATNDQNSDGGSGGGDVPGEDAGYGGEAGSVPEDLCALVSAEDVGAVLGETVQAQMTPSGDCQYPGGSATSLYPLISVQQDIGGAGGIEGVQSAAEAALGGTAEPLSVAGGEGFVVNGSSGVSTVSQGAVAAGGFIVSVSLSGGDPAGNTDIIGQLVELTISAL